MKQWMFAVCLVILFGLTVSAQTTVDTVGKVTTLTPIAVTTAAGDQIIETDVTIVDAKGKGVTFRVTGGTLNGLTLTSSYESVPRKGQNLHVRLIMKNGHYRTQNGQKSLERVNN